MEEHTEDARNEEDLARGPVSKPLPWKLLNAFPNQRR